MLSVDEKLRIRFLLIALTSLHLTHIIDIYDMQDLLLAYDPDKSLVDEVKDGTYSFSWQLVAGARKLQFSVSPGQ